jgi:squalene-hopene/tetraprenyl-beta-curcumene cyclase
MMSAWGPVVVGDRPLRVAPADRRDTPLERAHEVTERARSALVGLQSVEGWWKGELETNVTIDAEDLLLRQFLGIRTERQTESTARWIRSKQREDGTWATFFGGPADLSTTIEAYVALRLAGDAPEAHHMTAASHFVRQEGGLSQARVFTRIWMALFGLWSWEELPVMPPELMLLPPSVPLNIYDFGCWARQTVAALTVISAHRPVRHLPITIDELRGPAQPTPKAPSRWGRRLQHLDRVLHHYEKRPLRPLRHLALRRTEQWIVRRQEADGSWGGIQPPWVYSLMALDLQGYPLDHPVMRSGIEGLDSFVIEDEAGRHLEACQSPVWDTALAVVALADSGSAPADPVLGRAADWLVGKEVTVTGDWSVRLPKLAPGGWSFEFANVNYPDTDDTAEVVLALDVAGRSDDASVARAVRWIDGMQSRDGGWAAFDVDNVQQLCEELPFCDFGELIDPPSADVTAHVVEMLAKLGRTGRPLDRGVTWLLDAQEDDGSWFGRWGANHVYGTGAVLPALVAAGLPPDHGAVRHAVEWLESHQNEDGGWGEDLRSYRDRSLAGHGTSTASQTAWALLALLAADTTRPSIERGIAFLVDTQGEDGSWDEPFFTGTGFPGDFYINYHLYRLVFPLMALGRYLSSQRGGQGVAHD